MAALRSAMHESRPVTLRSPFAVTSKTLLQLCSNRRRRQISRPDIWLFLIRGNEPGNGFAERGRRRIAKVGNQRVPLELLETHELAQYVERRAEAFTNW